MEEKLIVHDLTLHLVDKNCTDNTPEGYVKAYIELLTKVKEAYRVSTKESRKGEVLPRNKF